MSELRHSIVSKYEEELSRAHAALAVSEVHHQTLSHEVESLKLRVHEKDATIRRLEGRCRDYAGTVLKKKHFSDAGTQCEMKSRTPGPTGSGELNAECSSTQLNDDTPPDVDIPAEDDVL